MGRAPDHPGEVVPAGNEPADDALILAHLEGDPTALRRLMRRYDRLVRYAIHRYSATVARRDPNWLDAVASEVWTGLIRAAERDPERLPDSIRAYLVQIARNQAISGMRTRERQARVDEHSALSDEDASSDPAAIATELEHLSALRACMQSLSDDDKEICAHMDLITARRWKEAATALGVAESTLRSRWGRILDALRGCLRKKTGESFAPEPFRGD